MQYTYSLIPANSLANNVAAVKFEVMLIWTLDRLIREGLTAIFSKVDKLKHYGVRVSSYQEPWTDGPSDMVELLYSITA